MAANQQPNQFLTEDVFVVIGLRIAGYAPRPMSPRTQRQRFCKMFGVLPDVVQRVWYDLLHHNLVPLKSKVDHLFWAMFFLKKYPTDGDIATKFGKDPTTLRKWVWTIIFGLQDLKAKQIRFPTTTNGS